MILFTVNKTKFLNKHRSQLNERQLKVVMKMLDLGMDPFEGGMTALKYVSITRSSRATATRDLQDLMDKNIVLQKGGGRSVKYELNIH